MAWFDRGPGEKKSPFEGLPTPVPSSAATQEKVAAESAEKEDLVAYLYKGSRVTGELTFHGPAKIEGSVEGEILCHGTLSVGEGAEVRAKISGEVVIIRGKVEGDVTAKGRVELIDPARVIGNIIAPRLIISEGVVFDGYCSMGRSREKGKVLSPLRSSGDRAFEGEVPKVVPNLEK